MKHIELTQGYVALVDDADYVDVSDAGPWFPLVAKRKDGSIRTVYVRRNVRVDGKNKQQYLHQYLMGAKRGRDVAHLDNNGLNCQRENLVVAKRSQTCAKQRLRKDNQFGYKGVSERNGYFFAHVGKEYIASFPTAEAAARGYDVEAKVRYGDFALLNFPQENS